MSAPLSQVLTTARTYLNDDAGQVFPDPVLIPKIQEAHRELQENLWIVGSPLVKGQALLAYTSGTTFPTTPTDFLCPTALFENATGSLVSASGWTPMTEAFYIPLGTTVAATLGWWAWQQEQIVIAGASVARAVILQYRRYITIPVLSTDLIGILFGESFLAARAAAIAAGSLGNSDLYTNMSTLAKENLVRVISANRGQQKPIIKP
jgi:hypothetical protein